jgi:two-component system, OmpR family, response regulator ChvI
LTSDPLSQQEGKKKILFVDDEPDLTTMLKIALEGVGFSIDIFNDPVMALESFKPSVYGLVILDIMMPKMNGFELYTQLKRVDPGIKVCFLTASSRMYWEELRRQKYSELGRELFLEMPLPTDEIIDEIKKLIGSP